MDCRKRVPSREYGNLPGAVGEQVARIDHHRLDLLPGHFFKSRIDLSNVAGVKKRYWSLEGCRCRLYFGLGRAAAKGVIRIAENANEATARLHFIKEREPL